MTLIEHAKQELKAAGYFNGEPVNAMMAEDVLALITVFGEQGHSGFSAPFCLELFGTLAAFKPLQPLSGKESEWCEVSEGLWQNKRCSRVFKAADGRAYDIYGRVFVERNGASYTSRDSRVYVTFPYTPSTEYIREWSPRWFVVKAASALRAYRYKKD